MDITIRETSNDMTGDRPALGERRLMAAVLLDALDILSTAPRQPSDRRLQAETWNWVMACDRDWPFSFDNLTEALGLDPDSLRGHLSRLGNPPVVPTRQRALREHRPGPRILRRAG